MNLGYLFVLQCVVLSVSKPSPGDEAWDTMSTTAQSLTDFEAASLTGQRIFRKSVSQLGSLTVKYTLMTLNSPDCDSSLNDDFPVRVQLRDVSPGMSGPGRWLEPSTDMRIMPTNPG